MNTLSEFIIRLLSPKPKDGEVLVMPFIRKDHAHYKPRRASSPDGASLATSEGAPIEPLPGQIKLDDALGNENYERI
jgi:hypothetical protein